MSQLPSTCWIVKMRDMRSPAQHQQQQSPPHSDNDDNQMFTYSRFLHSYHQLATAKTSPNPIEDARQLAERATRTKINLTEDGDDDDDCHDDDDLSLRISPLRESIITPQTSLDRRTRSRCETLLRISSPTVQTGNAVAAALCRSPRLRNPNYRSQHSFPSLWLILLHLLLLLSTGGSLRGVNCTVQNHTTISTSSSFDSHRNHSNSDRPQLPSSLISSLFSTQTPSSLLSTPTLLLEELLLQEKSLDDAIHKLKSAWNRVHGGATEETASPSSSSSSNDELISSHRVTLKDLPNMTREDAAEQIQQDSPIELERHPRSINSNPKNNGLIRDRSPSQSHSEESRPMSNCTRCRESARDLRIESIKNKILTQLGLDRAPNVSARKLPKIPPLSHLLEQYPPMFPNSGNAAQSGRGGRGSPKRTAAEYFGPLLQHEDQDDDFYVNAQKSIVFAQPHPSGRTPELRPQYFKFPANVINSNIRQAKLYLYLNGTNVINFRNETIQGNVLVYQIVAEKPHLVTATDTIKIASEIVKRGGWIELDVTQLVENWFHKPEDNFGLDISCYLDGSGQKLPINRHSDIPFDSPMRPYIVVQVSPQQSASIRRKRMVSLTCDDKSQESRCCRFPLTIDFDSFGWEWIIAPKKYDANYCAGECGLGIFGTYPHTHIVSQKDFPYNPTGPCCSPRKMSPISMLYMDHDYNIIYGILPNMVVDRCDCS